MVAYNFQPRFVPLIRDGMKLQTIRGDRAAFGRHARPGDRLQLYYGQRTKGCIRIVPDPLCTVVLPIRITFASGQIARIVTGGVPVRDLDMFAALDGFEDRADMSAFWLEHHGAAEFNGVVIEWAMPREEQGRIAA